jgi:hypothetical protein
MARRARTERRQGERAATKIAKDRERLFRLGPGGAPTRPIALESASVVEVRARSTPCSICGAETRVVDHTAETIDGAPLRLAHTLCPQCGHARVIYYRLGSALPN